jgi:hypothetical protein
VYVCVCFHSFHDCVYVAISLTPRTRSVTRVSQMSSADVAAHTRYRELMLAEAGIVVKGVRAHARANILTNTHLMQAIRATLALAH